MNYNVRINSHTRLPQPAVLYLAMDITPWKSCLLYSLSRRERVEFHLSRPRAANILKVGIFDVCVRIPVRICGGGGVCNVCVRIDVRIETKQ